MLQSSPPSTPEVATGLSMDDNIHAPTVASGPTSGAAPRDLSKLSMPDLMQEKERIEAELSALSNVLDTVSVLEILPLSTFFANF